MPSKGLHDRLVPRQEAADMIDEEYSTLSNWDCTKRHDLKPVKIDGNVYYYHSVLIEHLDNQLKL
jgi:hypothetical protein